MDRRLSRQIKIKWWDQHKISNTNVVVVGCGGIGCWTALQLTMLNVNRIVLVDMDKIEKSNLNRQFFYEEEVGEFKVDALKHKLSNINHKVKIGKYNRKIQTLTDRHFDNIQFVFDCLDNIETREYLDTLTERLKIPFIHSACSDVVGEVQLIVPGKTPRLAPYPQSMKKTESEKSCKDFDPAVCTTNMMVASLQVDQFLDWLIRKDASKPFVSYIRGNGVYYSDGGRS